MEKINIFDNKKIEENPALENSPKQSFISKFWDKIKSKFKGNSS